jgi:hypothetical protein
MDVILIAWAYGVLFLAVVLGIIAIIMKTEDR